MLLSQLRLSKYFQRNKNAVIFLSFSIFFISFYTNLSYLFKSPTQLAFFPPFIEGLNHNYNSHLGAEYYFIAQALAAGKGFSNPFQADTGPTAWMPPLYPFILAFLIKLFHRTFLVTCIIVFLKNIILIQTGLIIYEISKEKVTVIKAELTLFIYLVWLLTYYRWFFQLTHDEWLLLFFINAIFLLAILLKKNQITLKTTIAWGVLGGLSILASPIVGLVWGILWLFISLIRKNFPLAILSALIFFLFCSSWTIRNYFVFNKFIFIKSNFFFDAYHTNHEIKNGLYDESFGNIHPVWTVKNDPDSVYKRLGEVKFLEIYKEKYLNEIRNNPYTYMLNIMNRFCAALFVYHPYDIYERFIVLKSILHPLPIISIFLIVFLKKYKDSAYIIITIMIYSIYLIPYILVSYYIRYSIPLTSLKILLIFWGINSVVSLFPKFSTFLMPKLSS